MIVYLQTSGVVVAKFFIYLNKQIQEYEQMSNENQLCVQGIDCISCQVC